MRVSFMHLLDRGAKGADAATGSAPIYMGGWDVLGADGLPDRIAQPQQRADVVDTLLAMQSDAKLAHHVAVGKGNQLTPMGINTLSHW